MISSLIKQVLNQYKKWKFIPATKNILYHWVNRERKKSFGKKNPDKIFYVIRGINSNSRLYIGAVHNLMANYFYVVSHMMYAEKMGWIPVIDQLNYPVYNTIEEPINGSKNAWEYYFVQPTEYTLEEVYQSKNVVLSKRSWFGEYDMGYNIENYYNEDVISYYSAIAEKLHLNSPTQQHVEMVRSQYFNENQKVLGVAYRYGGHAVDCMVKGAGHPMQMAVAELIAMTEKLMHEWEMDKVFLTSDEETIVSLFQERFQDRLIVLPRTRRVAGKEAACYSQLYGKSNIHETTLGYLTEMELLANCDAFLGTVTSGVRYARIRNGLNYKYCKIIDNGLLPNPKKREL